ncbi:Endoplasmic reticulum, protein Pkr1 [Metarhizium album ARSEF 1941]|uniref:Endoplasmic reticulum, protein Pkr1 n=1 Tax=Metarhizium album (strain ARSEF 1941) TaxID=1081103 RepID=A0A0B2X0P1_METAS|nr:Endoplasmic reticulum, protein Pkr1 [Metarhizium album ARSEF 1941]KHN99858.1 Endoplasmic reticulum, protein Pkr1 [Metarhizium album ARSEF 1941]
MASFIAGLWESIFVPGPTPTILKATNATFAALQIVLLGLLVATTSIHFVVLSILCAGLWYSINWFANELAVAQTRQQQEAERATAEDKDATDDKGGDDSDTEVESTARQGRQRLRKRGGVSGVAGQANNLEASSGGETQSSVSTEDEWEKVSESDK